jgi:hypothetical protein
VRQKALAVANLSSWKIAGSSILCESENVRARIYGHFPSKSMSWQFSDGHDGSFSVGVLDDDLRKTAPQK